MKEKHNKGTRQDTLDKAVVYWNMRNIMQKFIPFVLYIFNKKTDARAALLKLNCIHEAKDTGNLICTKPLIFGYYKQETGLYESIVAGENLTHELWLKVKESFEKHGGKRNNDQEPEKTAVSKKAKKTSEVKFVRKYTNKNASTYEIYKCEDAELAKEFLMTKSVNKGQYYLIVETPTGNWGIDIRGLYKEYLLPWQNNIKSAEVEGHALGIPDSFSLMMTAKGINNNFLVSVKCGNCGHQWAEGLRYQKWTLVRCPNCKKKNKVSSENYKAIFV